MKNSVYNTATLGHARCRPANGSGRTEDSSKATELSQLRYLDNSHRTADTDTRVYSYRYLKAAESPAPAPATSSSRYTDIILVYRQEIVEGDLQQDRSFISISFAYSLSLTHPRYFILFHLVLTNLYNMYSPFVLKFSRLLSLFSGKIIRHIPKFHFYEINIFINY